MSSRRNERRTSERRLSRLWKWLKRRLGIDGEQERRNEERRKS